MALHAGVRVGFGTDLMGDSTGRRATERSQAARRGTRRRSGIALDHHGKRGFCRDSRLGRLTAGAFADAIMLTADPFAEPAALWEENARAAISAR